MAVKVWTKPETQKALRALRQAGFHVTRDKLGAYAASPTEGAAQCFRALPGMRGYLIRHDDELFTYAEQENTHA